MKKPMFLLILGLISGLIIGGFIVYQVNIMLIKQKATAFFALGVKHQERNVDEAISFFYQSLALSPDWYEPHLALAQAYERKNDLALAIKEYQKAMNLIATEEKNRHYDKILILSKIKELLKSEEMNRGKGVSKRHP